MKGKSGHAIYGNYLSISGDVMPYDNTPFIFECFHDQDDSLCREGSSGGGGGGGGGGCPNTPAPLSTLPHSTTQVDVLFVVRLVCCISCYR